MARIVLTTWGSLGDLHPFLALAIELKRRGHAAVVATLPAWRDNVERAGIEFQPIRPNVSSDDPAARDVVRKILDAGGGPAYLFTQVLGPSIRDVYADTLAAVSGADLLVSHQLPQTSPIVAERTGIRWVSAVVAPMGFLSAYDPPTPPQAPAMRRLMAMHPAVGRMFNRVARIATNRWMRPVYRLRAELGLPAGGHPLFEAQHSPARVLALFSPLLGEKQPDYPAQTVVTGFPFYDAAPSRPVDPELLAFLNRGEPPIVFTLGSSAVWIADDFYPVSIAAVRALGRRALLLVGENAQALRAQVPESIGVFDYAPHHLVMPRASVIVHQGGVGTTAQALRAGRPTLVVPFGQDQPDNARRVVALGVGRTISRGHYRVDRVVRELSALAEPGYVQRAHTVAVQVGNERGVENAADEVEKELSPRFAS
jgi:UDP:flavonoid glycosyltransferase YjiC (YdhE family)